MATKRFRLVAEDIQLERSELKTILRAKATALLQLVKWGISLKGTVTSNKPGRVRLVFQSDDGSMTSVTAVEGDSSDVTDAPVTGGKNASVEPTVDRVYEAIDVHPQTRYPSPVYDGVYVQVGERLAIDANFEQRQIATVYMEFLTTGA